MNYSCVLLVADALERAASADRAKITAALASSTFAGHVMPYGPTKFVNGQNEGAAPVNTQVLDNDIKVILPRSFREREAGLPDAGVNRRCKLRGGAIAAPPAARFRARRSRAFARHPDPCGPQRPDDRRGLCAGRARADADLRRAAHHQFRARRAAERRAVRGLLRLSACSASILTSPSSCSRRYSSRSAMRLQRFVIGPASHGDDRNMLLVTLGLAVVIENALLYAFRADTRTIDVPYGFQTHRCRLHLSGGAAA